MGKITQDQYYSDNTHVSHSMLCDFVTYNKYGDRITLPEFYYSEHILGNNLFEKTDAMIVGSIVDEYISEKDQWKKDEVLAKYPVVAKRSGNNPNEITKSMSETISKMISALESFKTLNDFISLPDTKTGQDDETILQKSIELPDGCLNLKWKVDFINHTTRQIVDLKTTGSVEMVLDGLMYKWTPILHARYIRQLAYYRYLASPDIDYSCALAVADGDWRIVWIPIRKDILDRAWEFIKDDLSELAYHYKTNFTELIKDPFKEFAEGKEEECIL